MTSLVDTLRIASKAKVDERLQPTTDALRNLRNCVDRYEAARREDVEVVILNEALYALGQEPVRQTLSVDDELRNLKRALFQVSPILGEPSPEPLPVVPIPEPQPAPLPEPPRSPEPVAVAIPAPPPPPKPVKAPKPSPEPTALDLERSQKLIEEVTTFAASDFSKEHPIRLQHLFQAWVAECRMILERVQEPHPVNRELVEQVIKGVSRLKSDAGVEPFIKGLAFGSRENWYRLAKDSRERVRKFDADVNESPTVSRKKEPKSSPKSAKPEAEASKPSYQWPELPLLRRFMKDTEFPLLIVGGSFLDQAKLEAIYERYGVRCEWCPFGHDNARAVDAISARIVTGKITGVMMLEGFMAHKAYRRLMKASDQNLTIPIAMAGKGGVTAIGNALDDIERQFAVANYKIGLLKPADEAKS